MNTAEFIQIRKFIVKLGIMLHKYGTPAFRLEAYLTELATYLGVRASFIATPTALTFVIWSDRREDEYNHSVRVQPGDYDMNALSRTDELATRLLAGEVGLEEADHQLDVINQMPSPYGKVLTGLGFCGATGAFAMLMGASWQEILWTSLIGLVVYFLVLWSQISRRVTLMLEPAASLVAGLIACAISFYFDHGINIPLVVLSSVIILVPGLALTMGLAELSTRNLVSGTARVMDAVMQLFKLYFGAFLGISIGFGLFGPNESQVATSLPEWSRWFAILMLCLALVVIFRTRFKHIPWALLSGFIAYGATVWSASYIDQGLSTFVGAFALGIYANLFTRIAHAPASLVSMQGALGKPKRL